MSVFTDKKGLPPYRIERAYMPAFRSSGTRPRSSIVYGVIHDMENTHYLAAAEEVGRYFESGQAKGSTHYGVDNNSIQQYLKLDQIPWGAPGTNLKGIHIEQMGAAWWPRDYWLNKAAGTLDRTAFIIAYLNHRSDIKMPIRLLTIDQIRAGNVRGWMTHRRATVALGGTHTDPGANYPLYMVLGKAHYYAKLFRER